MQGGKSKKGSRWTAAEDDLLKQGIQQFGYGAWTQIHALFPLPASRTVLQIKNRAQHIRDYKSAVDQSLNDLIAASYAEKYPNNPDCIQMILSNCDSILPEGQSPISIPLEEQQANWEFFSGGSKTKTPEKYLAIKNGILALAQATMPNVLLQKQCRISLRSICGDVNGISKVFSYLASTQQINAHAAPSAWPTSISSSIRPRRTLVKVQESPEHDEGSSRKRKVKFKLEEDEKETFSDDFSQEPDQFLLIPPKQPSSNAGTITATIKASAFALADMHAHCMHTEVIGLLGGSFASNRLSIEAAFPCSSCASSGTECEMDPLSELEARAWFQERNMQIIGWYHSHPLFVPHPSVRDVETQWEYQAMVKPFVGLIISPYDQSVVDRSIFRVFWVPGSWSNCLQFREPVNVPVSIVDKGEKLNQEQRARFSRLWKLCSQAKSCVKMQEQEAVGRVMLEASLKAHCAYELEDLLGEEPVHGDN
jgi:proteasome lid subunit RPN8/RPN11